MTVLRTAGWGIGVIQRVPSDHLRLSMGHLSANVCLVTGECRAMKFVLGDCGMSVEDMEGVNGMEPANVNLVGSELPVVT